MAKVEQFTTVVKPKPAEIGEEFGTRAEHAVPTVGPRRRGSPVRSCGVLMTNCPCVSSWRCVRPTARPGAVPVDLPADQVGIGIGDVSRPPREGRRRRSSSRTCSRHAAGRRDDVEPGIVISGDAAGGVRRSACFEQAYQVPKIGPMANKIVLRKLAYRPSDTVTFLLDDTGGF